MSSKSSGFRVKRSLSFDSKELPYAGKTFYIDIKSSSLKTKVSQRVLNLGGQIENFLSKDLTLLITEKRDNCNKTDAEHENITQTASLKQSKAIPLSRGQALLLKASGQASASVGNSSHGLVQSATKLGVEIRSPTGFLRCSSKLLAKVKAYSQKSKQEDPMCGMSPILWDEDKENMCVIKVEDEEGIFRPLLKHFEKFPQICYSECGSPFDVGIVLTKQNENNQSKKKTVSGRAQLGGYCESCDHWYKCSLREHLNSSKHRKFVAKAENFVTLNEVTSSLPDISRFAYKHGLKQGNIPRDNEMLPSSTYVSDKRINCELPVLSGKNSTMLQRSEQKILPQNLLEVCKNVSEIIDNESDISKQSIQSRNSQRFSLDDVLKSFTDINCLEKSSDFSNLNSLHANDGQAHLHLSNASNGNMHNNITTNSSTNHVNTSAHGTNCVLDKENVPTRHGFHTHSIPDANFSSSSYSFGDTGVGNVLSILNKDQESLKSQSLKSSCGSYLSVSNSDNKSTVSDSADALDIPVVNIGKNLEGSGNLDVNVRNSSGLECIGVLPHCDRNELQEDINVGRSQETTSGLNDELTVVDKKSTVGYQYPEYSNITEESNQSKPTNCDKTIPNATVVPSLDFHCLNFDTDLFGKDMNSVTPSKDHTDTLRAKICEKRANTGSTIRNWLIPMDDFASADSPAGLDATLIDTSVNCANIEIPDEVEANVKNLPVNVKDIEETNDTSKVAAWIQNNIFDPEFGMNAEKCVETNFLKCSEIADEKAKNIDDIGMDESCSVRKYNSGLSVDQDYNSAWSESGTSISDCTLPNFRANSSKEIASQINDSNSKNGDNSHITGSQEKDSDNISVKSCLSSTVTARGIKISGLSIFKNDSNIRLDTNKVCDKTLPKNSDLKQASDARYLNSDFTAYNRMTPNSEKLSENTVSAPMSSKLSVVNEDIPVVQNLVQSYRPIVPMPSSQTIHASEQLKSVAKNSKKKETPKGRKTTASQSKRTRKAPVLQNHVTSQNGSGAANPTCDPYNNFQHNHISASVLHNNIGANVIHNNQVYSNRSQQPALDQYGYHLNPPSNATNYNKGQLPQMQTCASSAYLQFENGTSMMDFLLSPGSQQPTNGQMQASQMQHCYAQPVHQGTHNVQNHQRNAASSFQQLPLYTHENTPPHFLSRNSNFLMYGSQHPSPKQSLPVNVPPQAMNSFYPQPSEFLSPGSSNHASRNLQTIDWSQIAESNSNDFTTSFNVSRPTQSDTNGKKCPLQSTRKRDSRKSISKNARETRPSLQQDNRSSSCHSNMEPTSCMSTPFVTQPKPQNSFVGPHVHRNQSVSPCLQGNQWSGNSVQYVPAHSLSPYSYNTVQTLNSTQHGYTHNHLEPQSVQTSHQTCYDKPSVVYNTEQTGAMKLTFRKMSSSNTRPEQSKNDLMHYWNVRKAGDCRLVFSANVLGKRKAEETPTRNSFMNDSVEVDSQNCEPISKRRRCLIY